MTAGRPGLLVPLGEFVAHTHGAAIPGSARRAARLQLLDMIAAVHASARSPECATLLGALPFGAGPSSVLATGARLAVHDAAFVNAGFSMAQDYDDILWMGHTGHSAVFASLAVAEAEGADADSLVSAIVVANEIAGRIGASSFLGPLNGQMWTFIHLAGAAAAAASILRLSPSESAHAIAIAMSQPTYALQPAFFGPTSKLLAAAIPTQIGVQAAYLARGGMEGALDILEDRRGFWKAFTFQPLPEMLGGLGDVWLTETLSIKAAPACHYFQTAFEAIAEIRAQRSFHLRDVQRVTIATTKLGDEVTRFAREYAGDERPDLSPIGASFDLGLAAAIALHAGEFTGDQSTPEWLAANAQALRDLYAKIDIEHDPALTMRVLDSASAIPAGKASLAALHIEDWVRLFRRYREHYGSNLLHRREALGWARTILARLGSPPAPASHPEGAIPLYFPNRVTIQFAGGGEETARVDLPSGSIARPEMLEVLRTKFMREVGPRLGERGAEEAFDCGLHVEARGLVELVRSASRRVNAPA